MKKDLEEVFAKCKRGSDKATTGENCESNRAYKMPSHNPHVSIFRCSKCNYQWSLNLGGSFSL